jgi:hypothetical protein
MPRTQINQSLIIVSILLMTLFASCADEKFSTDPSLRLSFSTDTLTFDTVFSTIGSVTSKVRIYNKNNSALKISQIALAGAKGSSFHINVDGDKNSDNRFKDVEIGANDSLYIFVAVTVDQNTPPLVEDSLVFTTNGIHQCIHLQAYGQDVVILKNTRCTKDTTLTPEKPFLVFGNLQVDSGKTLTINAGCKFYLNNNANFIVKGNLKAMGTLEKPILFRGQRLDLVKFATPFPYNNLAGQWGGIYLQGNKGNHTFEHVNMNSGRIGIFLQNEDLTSLPSLKISNSRIHNFLTNGLLIQNGNIEVTNSEISNSSGNSVYLNGGKQSFIHCTIANYFNAGEPINAKSRENKPTVMIMELNKTAPMESTFTNCIISGGNDNELSIASDYPDLYKGTFSYSYIKCPEMKKPQFSNIRWSSKKDNLFKNAAYNIEKNSYFDFSLDSLSPARDIADKASTVAHSLELDINGNNRMEDGKPDAGAYEWRSKK